MRFVEIVSVLSAIVVVGFCLFLIGLAVAIVTNPSRAERFLMTFASSARAHYTEQGLRLLVGAALVNFASAMWHPELFTVFGWLIVVTAVGLLLTPWQWHHKYGTRVIPRVIRHPWLFALGAAALGAFILYGVSRAVSSNWMAPMAWELPAGDPTTSVAHASLAGSFSCRPSSVSSQARPRFLSSVS